MKNAQYLLKKGLMNAGLVELTPILTARYNESLESMGIAPTKRKTIHVDGAGWSPEVAGEQKNPFYLCNGVINPNAIIISPEQYKKPVYFPVFSWERALLRQIFEKYHREILDITATNAISLDIENGLSSLVGPEDLLLLSKIMVVPNAHGIIEAAQRQQAAIVHFKDQLFCLETEARDAIVETRKAYGDMRKRRLVMEPVLFDSMNDFYTIAFEGAAVIRSVEGADLLVLESQDIHESIKGKPWAEGTVVHHLYDQHDAPFELLRKAGMIEVPVDRYRELPRLLEEKRDLLLALSLCDCEEEVNWDAITPSRRKSLMRKYEEKVPPIFGELERYIAALGRKGVLPELSKELWYYLAAPAQLYPPGTKEVLWILLTRKEPRNIIESYTYDKNRFLKLYDEWSDQKQKWVADYLAERYVPRMSRD